MTWIGMVPFVITVAASAATIVFLLLTIWELAKAKRSLKRARRQTYAAWEVDG